MEPALPVAVRVSLRIAKPPWDVDEELVGALVKAVGSVALGKQLIWDLETTPHARRHARLEASQRRGGGEDQGRTDKYTGVAMGDGTNDGGHMRSPSQVADSSAPRGRPRITIQEISAVSSMDLTDNDRFAKPEPHKYKWDVFLSYRVDADKENPLVEQVYDKLTSVDFNKNRNESLKVYWDRKALKTGEDFRQGFSEALCNSRVVVLVISRHTFNKSDLRQNCIKEDGFDNVLLEHEIALELFDLGRCFSCFQT